MSPRIWFIVAYCELTMTGVYPSPRNLNRQLARSRRTNMDNLSGWEVKLRNAMLEDDGYHKEGNKWVK